MPWLAWVYGQIDWDGPKELVLVDSTPGLGHLHPVTGLVPEDELVFIPSDDKGITRKYQQALESASGDVVMWLDDDDYHVPDAALRLVPYLERAPVVYPRVDLFWLRTQDLRTRHISCYWWGAGLYRREKILACPPFEGKSMCTEIRWIKRLARKLKFARPEVGCVGFCLSHARNIANHERRTSYRVRFQQVEEWTRPLGLSLEHEHAMLKQLERLMDRI